MLSSLTLGYYKKFTNWILSGDSYERMILFDTNLEPIMSSLANGTVVILKFYNSVLVQKSSLY